MKVFKFGGASVKNAESVRNVASIIKLYPNQSLVKVVSAMGKTTNALAKVVDAYFKRQEYAPALQRIQFQGSRSLGPMGECTAATGCADQIRLFFIPKTPFQ